MDRAREARTEPDFARGFLLGLGELIVRVDEPSPLLFWLPTLWGGNALCVQPRARFVPVGSCGPPTLSRREPLIHGPSKR